MTAQRHEGFGAFHGLQTEGSAFSKSGEDDPTRLGGFLIASDAFRRGTQMTNRTLTGFGILWSQDGIGREINASRARREGKVAFEVEVFEEDRGQWPAVCAP